MLFTLLIPVIGFPIVMVLSACPCSLGLPTPSGLALGMRTQIAAGHPHLDLLLHSQYPIILPPTMSIPGPGLVPDTYSLFTGYSVFLVGVIIVSYISI